MKKILLTSILMSFITIAPTQAQYMPVIPPATLQAAQQAVIQSTPSSEVVRVGIGTTNFGTYQYNDINIFGTGDTQIYDNKILIGNYPANQNIRITYKDGVFNIYTPESTQPETVTGPVQITSNYGLLGVTGLKRAGKQAFISRSF